MVRLRILAALAAIIVAVGAVVSTPTASAAPWYCQWWPQAAGCPTVPPTTPTTTPTTTTTTTTTTPASPTLTARDVTDTTANLSWTPTDANVSEVGRDGVDSYGGGAWSGPASALPFRYLIPDTVYNLYAVVNGTRLTTQIRTKPTPTTTTTTTTTPTTTTTTTTTPPPPPTTGKGFGFSTARLLYLSTAEQAAWLSDMRSLGMTWVRIDVSWADIQANNSSTYNWGLHDSLLQQAQTYGIAVDGVIEFTPAWARSSACQSDYRCEPADFNTYANFTKAAVQHFGSKMAAYEIWNEPNMNWYPTPSTAKYTQMLKLSANAMRSANPSVAIISAGLAPACTCGRDISRLDFVKGMYANGAKGYFTALGDHPYSYPAPPSDYQTWSAWSQMSQTPVSIRSIMADNGDAVTPVWMTEMGAPTNGPGAVSTCANHNYNGADHVDECLQAQTYTEAINYVKGYPWAGVLFFHTYKDLGTSTSTIENFFGVIRADGSHKPSYDAAKQAIG